MIEKVNAVKKCIHYLKTAGGWRHRLWRIHPKAIPHRNRCQNECECRNRQKTGQCRHGLYSRRAAQRLAHFRNGCESERRIPLQTPLNDCLQALRHLIPEQLAKNKPERVYIRPRIARLPAHLFGRRIWRSAGAIDGLPVVLVSDFTRKPEIAELNDAILSKQDILRLQIAMHDVLGMCGFEAVQDLPGYGERFGQRQWRGLLDEASEIAAVDILHHDADRSIFSREVLEDTANILMSDLPAENHLAPG